MQYCPICGKVIERDEVKWTKDSMAVCSEECKQAEIALPSADL